MDFCQCNCYSVSSLLPSVALSLQKASVLTASTRHNWRKVIQTLKNFCHPSTPSTHLLFYTTVLQDLTQVILFSDLSRANFEYVLYLQNNYDKWQVSCTSRKAILHRETTQQLSSSVGTDMRTAVLHWVVLQDMKYFFPPFSWVWRKGCCWSAVLLLKGQFGSSRFLYKINPNLTVSMQCKQTCPQSY